MRKISNMALSVTTPTYAFTNQFPNITVMGTAEERLLVSVFMGGYSVLEEEAYHFDTDGIATIRGIGNLLEKYFYESDYDIRRFTYNAIFTFKSGEETVTETVPVYFCRSYVGGDRLTPEMFRTMPLTRAKEKHTLPDAKEYLSFVSTAGLSVICNITYISNGRMEDTVVDLYTFSTSDTYNTVDVSASVIASELNAGEKAVYWDVYLSGHPDKAVRYWLDKPQSFPPTVFVFQNDFGGVESFVCRGIRKDEISAERETGVMLGRAFLAKQTILRSFTVNTGTLDSDQKEMLISLLSSYSLMVLQDNIAIPVIVSGENVSLHNFRSKLPTAEISYTYSARNLTTYKYNRSQGIFDYTFDETFN